jgi:protein TonB
MSPAGAGPGDRLGLTTTFALALHALFLFGLDFRFDDPLRAALPALDVILVQSSSPEPPEEADFLAQANQQGGGDSPDPVRPSAPFSAPLPTPSDGVAPERVQASAPDPVPATAPEVLTQTATSSVTAAVPEDTPVETMALPRGRELIEHSLEMARLSAELNRNTEAYAKRPRRKFISANTKEFEYATYMAAWVAKVERVGNLNYPDQARRQGLDGSLVLTVALRKDGSIDSIELIQPSGYVVLDDSARRIVEMAGPFAPIPQTESEDIDLLHITRTWRFLTGNMSMR